MQHNTSPPRPRYRNLKKLERLMASPFRVTNSLYILLPVTLNYIDIIDHGHHSNISTVYSLQLPRLGGAPAQFFSALYRLEQMFRLFAWKLISSKVRCINITDIITSLYPLTTSFLSKQSFSRKSVREW